MKAFVVAGLAALFTAADAADSEQKPCAAHMCGRQYDLSPLSSSSDYIITSHSGRNFTLNVCRSVISDLWNPRVDRPQDVGGFFRGDHGDFSIGQANTSLLFRNGNPVLFMTDGTSCPLSENMKASTAIQFICDKSAAEGKPQLAAQLPPEDEEACAFFIEWRTKYACPLPDRYAYWKTAVMVIVILLALTLTLLALLALQRLLRRRRLSDPYSTAPPLANGYSNGFAGSNGVVGEGPRSWHAAIAERARDVKRLLTGQDPWGHPNGYHINGTPLSGTGGVEGDGNANNANNTAGGGGGGRRKGWFPSLPLPSVPWSRSSRARRSNFSRLPRSVEEEAMMGEPFSVDDDDEDGEEGEHPRGVGAGLQAGAGGYAEESAAWGAARPRGVDASGVIRL
ncbi:hypothetical protein ACEPAH_1277 [Sanghuangporus vaninii]